ncbi:hypothetical protein HY638_05170 [Candidatus Woesearchaeota archaeon]|nr:hypothetical protein [Candidatus Woesearchaeota archaeon]
MSGDIQKGVFPGYDSLSKIVDASLIPHLDFMFVVIGPERRRRTGERYVAHPFEAALRPEFRGWFEISPYAKAMTIGHDNGEVGAKGYTQAKVLNEAQRYVFDSSIITRKERSIRLARGLDDLTNFEGLLLKEVGKGGSITDIISALETDVMSYEGFKSAAHPFLDSLIGRFDNYFSNTNHKDRRNIRSRLREFASIISSSLVCISDCDEKAETNKDLAEDIRYGVGVINRIMLDRSHYLARISQELKRFDTGHIMNIQEEFGSEEHQHSLSDEVRIACYELLYIPRIAEHAWEAYRNGELEPFAPPITKALDTSDNLRIPTEITKADVYHVARKSDAKIRWTIALRDSLPNDDPLRLQLDPIIQKNVELFLDYLESRIKGASLLPDTRHHDSRDFFGSLYEAFKARYENLALSPLPANLQPLFPYSNIKPILKL